jgi:hypothetical protein
VSRVIADADELFVIAVSGNVEDVGGRGDTAAALESVA